MPKATSSVSKGKRRKRSAEEIRQYKAQWYQRNKKRIRESLTEEQRVAKRASDKKYYAANRERICERQRRYNASHSRELVERKRQYRSRDPEKWRSYYKEYAAQNSDERKEYSRDYYRQNAEEIKDRVRNYATKNAKQVRDRARLYRRSREASDHLFCLVRRIGTRCYAAIRSAKARKSDRTIELIGCSPAQLAAHLESQFKAGMGWRNRSKWHVDHIVPLAAFDLSDPTQQRVAFHYSNLQPLWKHENLSKGARLSDGTSARGSRYRTARYG
jgi:hypothetical protein